MPLTSARALAGPVLALAGMAPRLTRGAAASTAAAGLCAATVLQPQRQCVRRQQWLIGLRQPGSSSRQTHSSGAQWRIQRLLPPQLPARCLATSREQEHGDTSGNIDSPAASSDSCQDAKQSEQPERVGRGSLAPEVAGKAPSDADEKSMTYREMLADWFYTRSVLHLIARTECAIALVISLQQIVSAISLVCVRRETDLRSLAAEGRLQLQNFLADPSVTVLGR